MATEKEPSISIHKTNGKDMIFLKHIDVRYYLEPMSTPEARTTSLLQSVDEIKSSSLPERLMLLTSPMTYKEK
jgi:hypothetical protein